MAVFGIAGHSGMGKTTLLERLIPALVARGLKVVVYAEQVHSAEEWAAAAHLGVSGMTGPEASRRQASR